MSVATETLSAIDLMDRVETLERVAGRLLEQDDSRSELLRLAANDLATAAPLRPRVVATLLGLSERTVRAWVGHGVLLSVEVDSPRLLLDVERVHEVLHLLKDMRELGQTAGLLDEVHRRLVDGTWLERDDLIESIEQMRRGEGRVIATAESG